MINLKTVRMNAPRKVLLSIMAAAVAVLLVTGFVVLPKVALAQIDAKAPQSIEAMVQERAQRLAEQRQPRTIVAFDPSQFDKYVGSYQLDEYEFFTLSREGDHFFGGPAGREDQKVELYPESSTKFFAKAIPAQISFVLDSQGKVTGAVFHSNGFEGPCSKVDESVVKAALAGLAERIKSQMPSPGTEAALRRYIEAFQHGRPDYDDMIPIAAVLTRERFPEYVDHFQKWGALKSLAFVEVMPNGFNKYLAVYERSRVEMIVEPLSPDGKIDGIRIGKIDNQ